VRELTPEEIAFLRKSADNYVQDSEEYRSYVQGPPKLGENDYDLEDPYIEDGDIR
jgi:hypothetical protein